MIAIKSIKELQTLLQVPYHQHLITLISWASVRYSKIIITSAYRPGDAGIHGTIPCRALDLRSRVFEEPEKIAEDINAHWVYDPLRPHMKCCVYHDAGSGLHFHIQVHDRTRRAYE